MPETLLETLEAARRREHLEESSRVRGALSELLALLRAVAPKLAPRTDALRLARLAPAARPLSWGRATIDTQALEQLVTYEPDGSLTVRLGLRLGADSPEARTAFVRLRYSVPDRRVRVAGSRWLEPSAAELMPALREALEREVASWYPRGRARAGKKAKAKLSL